MFSDLETGKKKRICKWGEREADGDGEGEGREGDEIKCPFSVRDGKPKDLVGRIGSFLSGGGLIHNHKYLTQVQGQLEICRKFVILSYGHQMVYIFTKDTRGPTLCGKNYASFYNY